jgi:cytochrome c oxidase subunit II
MSHAQQDPVAASAPFDSRRSAADSRLLTLAAPAAGIAQAGPREIPIVARRFAFDPARVDVVEGERIRLVVTSEDGVHGIEIKKFKVHKKVPRGGGQVTIDFVASAPGEFPILCSEYCGNGHQDMTATLVVAATGSPR